MLKPSLLLLSLLLLLTGALWAQSDPAPLRVPPGETVKLAVAGDLSNAFPISGVVMAQSAEIAATNFNAQDNLYGFQVELVIEDDLCTPEGAEVVAQIFVERGDIAGVVGHICSDASLAALPYYEAARIPMVSPQSTSAIMTAQGYETANRVVLNDNVQGVVAARYIHAVLGVEQMAIVHNQTSYGEALGETIGQTFADLGGDLVFMREYDGSSDQFEALAAEIVAQNIPLVYIAGYVADASLFSEVLDLSGGEGVIVFSGDGAFSQDFIDFSSDYAEGVYLTAPVQAGPAGANEAFDSQFEGLFGSDPNILDPYHPHAHDAAMLLLLALQKVAVLEDDGSLLIDREALIEAVRSTRRYRGLTGVITCSETGECGQGQIAVYQVQGGAWAELDVPEELQLAEGE
jgi:branched-chain amino acid transport system substrate-binding protein